jgi:hypothetical protein
MFSSHSANEQQQHPNPIAKPYCAVHSLSAGSGLKNPDAPKLKFCFIRPGFFVRRGSIRGTAPQGVSFQLRPDKVRRIAMRGLYIPVPT